MVPDGGPPRCGGCDLPLQFDTDREMLERTLDLSSQELLQANSEMRAVFRVLPDMFIRLDREGTILDCRGGSFEGFTGQSEKLRGKKLWDVPLLGPEEAVRAYHGELQKAGVAPARSLEEDRLITEDALKPAASAGAA